MSADALNVQVPSFMTEIVAEMSQQARRSPHINQRSGVSVRLSIANYETLVANATRRALRHGETEVVPRVSDLEALVASTAGKLEFETVDDGREEQVLDRIVHASVLETFRARTRPEKLTDVVNAFDGGQVVITGEDIASTRVRQARRRHARAARDARRPRGGGDARGHRVGGRVRARGPAPVEAPQQGRGRRRAPRTAAAAELSAIAGWERRRALVRRRRASRRPRRCPSRSVVRLRVVTARTACGRRARWSAAVTRPT